MPKGLNSQHTKSAKNCVIYTRVSSKEQAEHNSRLSSQKRYCEEFFEKHGYTNKAYFGGTYDSAKEMKAKSYEWRIEKVVLPVLSFEIPMLPDFLQ